MSPEDHAVSVTGEWPTAHLCMQAHPSIPDVYCRKLKGHLARGEKHAPALSDLVRRRERLATQRRLKQ